MKGSWHFFAALVAGFALALGVTATGFYLNLGVPTDGAKWNYQVNEKKRLLAEKSPAPKLLLVGGSATLFGISAKQIQEQTGWPTVSLATHAGLGTAYILYTGRRVAKPGDVVLLTLEYELYWYGKVEQGWAAVSLIEYLIAGEPSFFLKELTPEEQWNVFMLTSNRRLIRGLKHRSRREWPEGSFEVYDIRNINEWGDQAGHLDAKKPARRESAMQSKTSLSYGMPAQPKGFPLVEAFCKWAQTNHVTVLATFPNMCDAPEYHTPLAQETIKRIKQLYAGLNVPVLGEYTDALLPREQFYDTIYHPTEEAARARTERLARQLIPYLKKN